MRIAIQGCCHGELNKIYAKVTQFQTQTNSPIQLLLICGDFQAIRDDRDFAAVSIPRKYQRLGDFHEYYSGRRVAPVLTVFIGGNHEVSNVLGERYYGGWLAPNIYYLGHSGCIRIGPLTLAGISGIFSEHHYRCGYFESFPYVGGELRSCYHTRRFEIEKLLHLSKVDIFMSHEWPRRVYNYGDIGELLRKKPYFKAEIAREELGCPGCEELMHAVQPRLWIAAHLHCLFEAKIGHEGGSVSEFMALDKCTRSSEHFRVVEVDDEKIEWLDGRADLNHSKADSVSLEFDMRWLSVLFHYQDKIPRSRGVVEIERIDDAEIEKKQREYEELLGGRCEIPKTNEEISDLFLNKLKIKPANILLNKQR